MAAEGHEQLSSGEYILHHLTFWQNKASGSVADFSVLHIDSMLFSIGLAIVTFLFLWAAARKATSGVPGRFQAAVEMLVEMVDGQAKGIVHNAQSRKLVAPLALAVFIWIVFMNTMDLLPVDLLPLIRQATSAEGHEAKLRIVPTADLSITMGLSVSVLLLCLVYNIKIKGLGGWVHELFTAPFGNHWALYPFNFAMQIIEFVAKTVSHGMRLFGNMYAGELIFLLIAMMGGAWSAEHVGMSLALAAGHVIAGTAWAIFHILIIVLQAFVFMMLALVYLGQAHDAH
jgi:F-type H+-transporting ATPase subunit a